MHNTYTVTLRYTGGCAWMVSKYDAILQVGAEHLQPSDPAGNPGTHLPQLQSEDVHGTAALGCTQE